MKIYVDLDETLISSHYLDSFLRINKHCDHKQWWFVSGCAYSISREEYVTYLRPHAKYFLEALREAYGVDNVLCLTAAMYDYAVGVNNEFDLGFTNDQIIGREHYVGSAPIYENLECGGGKLLIDNARYDNINTSRKITYLGGLGEDDYIKAAEFYVTEHTLPEPEIDRNEFDRILSLIKLEQQKTNL